MKRIGFEDKFVFNSIGDGKFECRDEIGSLWGVEKLLEIVDREQGDVFDLSFFEFGSAEFSVFTKIPMSGKVSHFMMFGTNFEYSCFDSEVCEDDFDLVCEIVNLHKNIISGDFLEDDDFRLRECLDIYSVKCQEKDLPVPLVYEAFSEEITSLGIYYDLDLEILRKRVKESSFGSYEKIVEKINDSKNPVVFSLNVLNAPSLSGEFPFWEIKDVFHVHGVNEIEFLAKMGLSNYFVDKLDRRGLKELGVSVDDFIFRFKEMFGIVSDVEYADGFFWWKG